MEQLLEELGSAINYAIGDDGECSYRVFAESGRRVIFAGDLVDRDPRTPDVLRLTMAMVGAGEALRVPGNHDAKFLRWLNGCNVKMTHGVERPAEQMAGTSAAFRNAVKEFLDKLVSHLWLDGGKLVVEHAGIKEDMIGRSSGAVRAFCLYGETTGESDEYGLPVRHKWAADCTGSAAVVYGHTPVIQPEWLNNTSASIRAVSSAAS